MRRVSVPLSVGPEIKTLSAILLLSIGNSTQSDLHMEQHTSRCIIEGDPVGTSNIYI